METKTQDLNSILTRLLEVALDLGRYQKATVVEVSSPDIHSDDALNAAKAGLVSIAARLLKEADSRTEYFPSLGFHDSYWSMLLDLYIQAVEQKKVTISDAAIAARVPNTTALRWIGELVKRGVIVRTPDGVDRRRCYVNLSAEAFADMSRYLAGIAGIVSVGSMVPGSNAGRQQRG